MSLTHRAVTAWAIPELSILAKPLPGGAHTYVDQAWCLQVH